MVPKIAIVSLAGQYEVGFEYTAELASSAAYGLKQRGLDVIETGIVMYDSVTVGKTVEVLSNKSFDLICVVVGTWSEDHHLLDLLDYIDKPVVLWAFPAVETGSLCGVQQICCVLKELNKDYFYIYGDTSDLKALDEIVIISKAIALKNFMSHVKIGTIGGRIKGMTEIAFDEFEVKSKTGVRVVNLDEDELKQAFDKSNLESAKSLWYNLKSKTAKVTSTDSHGIESIRYYQAMVSLVSEYNLDGLCIKCYPHLMGKICLGYSLLSEEGIVCGCEGDLNSTVVMKMLYELSGQPVHNTDLLYPDVKENTILFSHCGSGGFSIADCPDNVHIAPVRLAGSGCCSLFPAKTGKVTLVNLVGRKGTYRMSIMVGDSVATGMEFPGNPLKVKFKKDVIEINQQIAEEGIGHHWMGGYGDFSKELECFCKLNVIRLIKIE
jgi:L-fucose isomerase-like protein